MLSHLRAFYIISFIIVLLVAFGVGIYLRSVVADNFIKKATEDSTEILATSYVNNIWSRYNDTIGTLANTPLEEWEKNEKFTLFHRESQRFFSNLSLTKLSIYSPSQALVFSNNLEQITPQYNWYEKFLPTSWLYDRNDQHLKVVSGSIDSRIFSSASLISHAGISPLKQGSYIQILIPLVMQQDNPSAPHAIMEVYYDISSEWSFLIRFQLIITSGIILFFALFISTTFYVSRRAERIIDKQHEANLELTEAKARAESESEEKSKFLANVSHELRTPLNAIIGFSQVIKDETNGPIGNETYKDYINDINNSGTHLLSLINDILDYSKAEANKLDVDQVDIDLNKAIQTSLRLVSPRAQEAKVNLIEKLPKEHIILKADSKRIKQVFLNLLSNSVKFTPENGNVTLSAAKTDDGGVKIEVNDNGIGIAQKDISKAMAAFGQVDSKLSRRFEGTGLGLPLTKKLVEIMGGTFEIQSELGLGTTITLRFPKEKVSIIESSTPTKKPASEIPPKKENAEKLPSPKKPVAVDKTKIEPKITGTEVKPSPPVTPPKEMVDSEHPKKAPIQTSADLLKALRPPEALEMDLNGVTDTPIPNTEPPAQKPLTPKTPIPENTVPENIVNDSASDISASPSPLIPPGNFSSLVPDKKAENN